MSGMMKKKNSRITAGERAFKAVNSLLLLVFMLLILVPLMSVVATSLVGSDEVARRGQFILIPEKINLSAYDYMLKGSSSIWRAYKNTLFVVGVGTCLSLVVTISMAYPLSKKELRGRTLILGMVFFTMLFSGGMIPNYMLVKELGLLNKRWVLVLPYVVSTWNMLLMRNFFYSVPESLEEAAYLDGANQIQVLIRVVLPLSLPSIATIGLFYAVGYWNQWFPGVMYITKNELMPVQNILRTIVISASGTLDESESSLLNDMVVQPTPQTIRCAAIVVSTLPILVVYPFIQKYFVKGVMVGSVKG